MRARIQARLAVGAAVLTSSASASAFAPYRSTDAATADPWVFEPRLGLVKLTRQDAEVELTTPLVRLNLGLPAGFELTSEAEYAPAQGRLGDAAAGGKWALVSGRFGIGTELLALLPVSDAGGLGIEAQALASFRPAPLRLHLNAGGFADGRSDPAERGWRASALAELELGNARPGVEVFAKRVADDPAQVLLGVGSITDVGPFDLRVGTHAGLTDASPELIFSVWVSTDVALGD